MTNTTANFVIRSMSTTDAGQGRTITPYHIYLMPPEKRTGAYWSSAYHAQKFETAEAAQAEIDRCKLVQAQVSTLDDPVTYWDRRDQMRAQS